MTTGVALHFWRDLSEWGSGVALLWPVSDHSFTTSHGVYLALMGLAIAASAARLGLERVRAPRPRAGAAELATR